MSGSKWSVTIVASAVAAFIVVMLGSIREAGAVPSFSRKYHTTCMTCHTVYPMLNPFGEAFRRNGYRLPSVDNSKDSDSIRAQTISMGEDKDRALFPASVIADKIMEAIPLSIMLNGAATMNFPDSDAKTAAGNVFTWAGIIGSIHISAAGAFNNNLTYMTHLTINTTGEVEVEVGYLLWNDIVGPRHLFNLWIGRLYAPQLTSFGVHSSYLSDTVIPAISIAGLYNPTGSFAVGNSPADGIELNGIIAHRFAYSLGWVASTQAAAFPIAINAEDVYAHIGAKLGGIALDGEGKRGPNPPDPKKPWAETSMTLDLFAYHGMSLVDNGTTTVDGGDACTEASACGQRNAVGVLGGSLRAQLGSAILTTGLQFEHHDAPYQGTAGTLNPDGSTTQGNADLTKGEAWVQYNELDYVIFPWLVPGVRTELTTMTLEPGANSAGSSHATLFRFIPGIAALVRPNIKVVLSADFEYAYGMPITNSWTSALGSIVAPSGQSSKIEAETLTATVGIAF